MTRVLITGVAGFIGSHVAEHCLKLGFDVVGVDDLSGGYIENVPQNVDFRQGTVTDSAWIESLWQQDSFDYVYHLAAYAAEGLSHFIRHFNYETNLLGSINLINQSILHEVKCFVFSSSIAVYGAGQVPMTEDLTPQPEDPYGISKYAVELDIKSAHQIFGLPYIIFRPHNVYGERQNIADKYRNVIGIFMNQTMHGQPMSVFGHGLQSRAFSHVDEVAPIIAQSPLVQAAYQQLFNIGAEQGYTILELANEIARAFGVPADIKHLPARQEVEHAISSHDKIKHFFTLPKPVPLRDGIQRMAAWAKARGPVAPLEFKHAIEVPINLPASWIRKSQNDQG